MREEANTGVGHRHEQLTLALIAQLNTHGSRISTMIERRTRIRPARESCKPRAARATTAPGAARARKVPSRDNRGRFVAYSTTNAPSWYVFCCDGYRIPGEAPVALPPAAVPVPASATPRKPRLQIRRADVESLALVLLILMVSAWYGLQLPIPNR
jgi:hypothetical protein